MSVAFVVLTDDEFDRLAPGHPGRDERWAALYRRCRLDRVRPAGFDGASDASPSEWQAGVETAECFIAACDYTDIDPRGPVFLRGSKTQFYACTEHWEAIIGILGRQVTTGGDAHRWWPDA